MNVALAAAPIGLILALMAGLHWSAVRAGLAGFGLTVLAATFYFGTPGDAPVLLGGAMAEAVFTALTILWILLPALAIYELQRLTGAVDILRHILAAPGRNPLVAMLLVAWFFGIFFEGAAGFGTPVALAAPLLVSIGVRAEEALTAALIGHVVGVSFGAIGTPIVAQAAEAGLSASALAVVPALFTLGAGWVCLLAVLRITKAPNKWATGALAFAAFGVPFFLTAALLGPELPSLLAALLGGTVFVWLTGGIHAKLPRREILNATAPYLALIVLVVVTRLIPPVQEAARSVTVGFEWRQFTAAFEPLYHPGTLLVLAFLTGACVERVGAKTAWSAVVAAARRLAPVVVALIAMLGVARLLVHAGMVETLAAAAAVSLGSAWPVAAPFVGALGTFVTGSATASNVLFTQLQASVAQELSLSAAVVLGAQTFGAAVGNMIAPHNIVAGCATVGLSGREGPILRKTLPVALITLVVAGALSLILAALWPAA